MTRRDDIIDVHTHRLWRWRSALVSVSPEDVAAAITECPEARFSAGLHPWRSAEAGEEQLSALRQAVERPEVLAVGETGLDGLRGAPIWRQTEIMRCHVELSEMTGKPLIVHLVKCLDEMLGLRREMRPRQPWVIHGFRGKPQQARTLLDAGCMLSFGVCFNPDTVRYVPADRLLTETDERAADISEVIAAVAAARGDTAAELTQSVSRNMHRLLGEV